MWMWPVTDLRPTACVNSTWPLHHWTAAACMRMSTQTALQLPDLSWNTGIMLIWVSTYNFHCLFLLRNMLVTRKNICETQNHENLDDAKSRWCPIAAMKDTTAHCVVVCPGNDRLINPSSEKFIFRERLKNALLWLLSSRLFLSVVTTLSISHHTFWLLSDGYTSQVIVYLH